MTSLREQEPGSVAKTMFAGQVIVGGAVSRTITRCRQVLVLPCPSVAVQVTKLVPGGKTAGALLVMFTEPQLSLATGIARLTLEAKQELAAVLRTTSAGQISTGGWVSRTTTRCTHMAILPLVSTTVQVTVFVPTA